MTVEEEFEFLIVGAGVVGCALSYKLSAQGRKVGLIERDWSEPDRIVGELMQPGGVQALRDLGMEGTIKGIDAVDCFGYEVFYNGQQAHLPYSEKSDPNVQKGCGFVHGKFIQKLRSFVNSDIALEVGQPEAPAQNVTCITATAIDLIRDQSGKIVKGVKAQESKSTIVKEFKAKQTILCDGCFSRFRKEFNSNQPKIPSNFVGLVLKNVELPVPNFGHIFLAETSPVLLYQIASDETRILIDVPGSKLPSTSTGELQKIIKEDIKPRLPKTLQPALLDALENSRIRFMPNNWLPPARTIIPGSILVGDALNMRHPLTGGGMTVGLNDAVLICDMLSPEKVPDLGNYDLVCTQLKAFLWKRKEFCGSINILANALYGVFAGDDYRLVLLRNGCFEYLKEGYSNYREPIGLLSGLIRRPLLLVYHFYAVAFYSIRLHLQDKWKQVYRWPILCYQSISTFFKACQVLGPFVWAELKSGL